MSRPNRTRTVVVSAGEPELAWDAELEREKIAGAVDPSLSAAYARVADMLIRGHIKCSVVRIPARSEPCGPEVSVFACHYRADFDHDGHHLGVELSTNEPQKVPYPQLFLMQVCMSSLVVNASHDFEDWRAVMGTGRLADDQAMFAVAREQTQGLTSLLTASQLALLEQATIEQLGAIQQDAAEGLP